MDHLHHFPMSPSYYHDIVKMGSHVCERMHGPGAVTPLEFLHHNTSFPLSPTKDIPRVGII